MSARARGPFRAVNLPAVPHELFESVLFGHERGAFTGAVTQSTGAFEQAHEGTLFLDEIASLALAVQPKLLRVIQEGEVEPVGGRGPKQCDVRVVAAANLDLVEAVRRREFREDLYHRLSVVTIEIPPLRQRVEDIPLLVSFFVDKYAAKFGRSVPEVSGEAMVALQREPWTGNVRELENCVQRALVLASGDRLERDDFVLSRPERSASRIHFACCDYCLEDVEKAYIERVLEHTDGNQSQAARILGIDRKTLRAKRERFGSVGRHELQSVS
jgi:two-component system response regulator HydG